MDRKRFNFRKADTVDLGKLRLDGDVAERIYFIAKDKYVSAEAICRVLVGVGLDEFEKTYPDYFDAMTDELHNQKLENEEKNA